VLIADPSAGLPSGAPYRLMLVEGAVAHLPAALTNQLGEGGRLALVRAGRDGPVCRAVLIRRAGGSLSEHWAFETTCPVLPDFSPPPGFVF
jgi:protein-L-isoaspartate(D-aspartate) O-methyltransferase